MIVCIVEGVDSQYVSSTVQVHCNGCEECHHDPKKLDEKCAARLWLPSRHMWAARGKDGNINRAKAANLFMRELGFR